MKQNVITKSQENVDLSKRESQGYIDSLENKTIIELRDMLERQNKLLAHKSFCLKLPDRGEKIIKFRNKVLKEIEHRDEIENAVKLMSRLNIVSEGKNAINELEWTGKYNEKATTQIVELDIDDETNPLKILAQPTGTGVHNKKIINLAPEESLITPADLKDIESFKNEDPLQSEHVKYIIDKAENHSDSSKNKRQSFKPYKTTLSNVHDPEKEKMRKKHSHWEVTAATPPTSVHGTTKILSLSESLKLQIEQTEKLKEIQAKYAIEKLTENIGLHTIGKGPTNVSSYRISDHDMNESNSENEEEVHDDECDDKVGTVIFPVDN